MGKRLVWLVPLLMMSSMAKMFFIICIGENEGGAGPGEEREKGYGERVRDMERRMERE